MYTGSTQAGGLLVSPGENAEKVGTILPLPYRPLCMHASLYCFSMPKVCL